MNNIKDFLPKSALIPGEYYVGTCRNAKVARWDGNIFHHWRTKWGSTFIETIKHPEDEEYFDVFFPFQVCNYGVNAIPLEGFPPNNHQKLEQK